MDCHPTEHPLPARERASRRESSFLSIVLQLLFGQAPSVPLSSFQKAWLLYSSNPVRPQCQVNPAPSGPRRVPTSTPTGPGMSPGSSQGHCMGQCQLCLSVTVVPHSSTILQEGTEVPQSPTGAQECQPGAGSGPWGHLLTSSAHECFHFCGPLQPQSELPPAGAPAAPQWVCCCLGPPPPAALSTCCFCLSPHPSGRKLRLCCHLWGPPSLLSDLA